MDNTLLQGLAVTPKCLGYNENPAQDILPMRHWITSFLLVDDAIDIGERRKF